MNNDSRRKIWENIFQLSQAVFRVTHLFPKEEILRRHLRAKITEILYQTSLGSSSLISSLHDFRGLLFSSKNCNFVKEQNFSILIKECAKIIELLESSSNLNNYLLEVKPQHIFQKSSSEIQYSHIPVPEIQPPQDSTILSEAMPLNLLKSSIGFFTPNSRQQKLLDHLQKCQNEKIQLKDIAQVFQDVQPRTIRQDLKELCDGGYLIRSGNGAGSYYTFSR